MEVTGPFTLALGQETGVVPPNGSTRFTKVVLANASPYSCMVNSGGVAQWLQAWSADVYPCDAGNPAYVTPQFSTSSSMTTAQITASWYLDTDTLDGTYPVPLTSQAIAAEITAETLSGTQFLGQQSGAGGSAFTLHNVAVPAGITSIGILIAFTGGAAAGATDSLGVSGITSGRSVISLGGISTGAQPMWPSDAGPTDGLFLGSIVADVDTALQVTYSNGGPHTGNWTFYVFGYVNPPEPHNTRSNPLSVVPIDGLTLKTGVRILDSSGTQIGLTNPLYTKLSDGANALGTTANPLFVESPALTQNDGINSGFCSNTTTAQPIVGAAGTGLTRRIKKMQIYTFGTSTGPVLCEIIGHTSGVTYHALSLNSGANGQETSDAVFNVAEGFDIKMTSANGLTVVGYVVSQALTLGT